MRRLNLGALVTAALLSTGSVAWAQDDNAEAPPAPAKKSSGLIIDDPGAGYGTGFTLSALGSFGAYGSAGGIGVAGIFGFPIVRDGFIPSLNDSFHIEAGLFTNVGFYGAGADAVYISPAGGVRWDFHIVQEFTAYAALRTGVAISATNRSGSLFYFDGLVGGFWRFSKPVAVRFELGGGIVGGGISGGVAFFF